MPGKELAGGSDSQVNKSVFSWSSAAAQLSTIRTGTAQHMALGYLLQSLAPQWTSELCAVMFKHSLLCLEGLQFLVFAHCLLEMFKELTPVDLPSKQTNLQKTKIQNFYGKRSGEM